MSELFEGEICPVCKVRFFEDDDVVFCPECGTPHHRECWKKDGHCFYADQHGTRENWQPKNRDEQNRDNTPPRQDKNESYRQGAMTLCRNCGKIYPKYMDKCPACGANPNQNFNGNQRGFDPFGNNRTDNQQGFNFADPLGGVDPETDIEGAKAIELAPVVAGNTRRYIPLFARKKKAGWNWAAFLIPQYWLMYRKCYLWGIVAAAISLCGYLLQIPFLDWASGLIPETGYIDTMQIAQLIAQHMGECGKGTLILAYVGTAIAILVRVIFAIFGDYIYRRHCISTLNEVKTDTEITDFSAAIMKKGGVSFIAPLLTYILLQVLEMFLPTLL